MKTKMLIAVFSVICYSLSAQITVDLAKDKITSETIDVSLKPVLIVTNMLPVKTGIAYSFAVDMVEEAIPAISASSASGVAGGKGCNADDNNQDFITALAAFNAVKNEADVSAKKSKLQKEMAKIKDKYPACWEMGNAAIQTTEYEENLKFSLEKNQTITVTVKKEFKTSKGNDTTKVWKFVFKTPQQTPWHILYGFTFVPNLMNPEKTFFTKADTSGKSFTITEMNNQKKEFWKNISPTIMIQWAPMTKYNIRNNWKAIFSNHFYQLGFVSGLSLNFASETGVVNVMAGPSLLIADNVSLSGGFVFTQKNVLMGKYKEGDVVKENLEFDQLHEKKYMLEWFFSLAIRFDTNPFAKKETAK